MDEKLTAIYLLAIKRLDTYVPIQRPIMPNGFDEVYQEYKMCNDKQEKAGIWKSVNEEYPSYFKELDRVDGENRSNINFLKEMITHFEKIGMNSKAEQVQLQLHKYNA